MPQQPRQFPHIPQHPLGTGGQQRLRRGVAAFQRAIAPDGGPGSQAGLQAGQGVFNHQTAARVALQRCGGGQVHVREGLGARQVVAAEDVRVEQGQQAHLVQLHQHLGLVRAAGHGDLAAQQSVALAHGGHRAGDGVQMGVQPLVTQGIEGRHPGIGERLAGFALDAGGFAAHGLADEDTLALFGADRPACGVEHVAQCAQGDGFAIDEHAVAVEQDGFKLHACLRFQDLFKLVAIHIPPARQAVRHFADKAAAFVQAHGAALLAVAGDEFHGGVVVVCRGKGLDLQAQPFRCGVEVQAGGAGVGVPGGQQVGGILAHECAVARAHEVLGIGGGDLGVVVDEAAAAGGVGQGLAFGAGAAAGAGGNGERVGGAGHGRILTEPAPAWEKSRGSDCGRTLT